MTSMEEVITRMEALTMTPDSYLQRFKRIGSGLMSNWRGLGVSSGKRGGAEIGRGESWKRRV
jgi:hypothetical protein